MSYFSGKRVVVTGASGLLGHALVPMLLEAGAKVRAVVRARSFELQHPNLEIVRADLESRADSDRALAGAEIACLCASHTVGAAEAVHNPVGAVTGNLVMAARTMESAMKAKADRVLIVSSTTVYPTTAHAVKEEEGFVGEPHPVYQGVANMKRYIERLARFYADKYGMKYAIVRSVPFFGPHDNFDFATCHVIPSLIRKAVEKLTPFEVWGDGKEVRDFLHVSDVARGCLLAVEKYAVTDPLNLGSGRTVTVREIAEIITREAGHEIPLQFDPTKPSTIPIRVVDTSKAAEKIGFAPRLSLEEGLRDAITWFRDNRARILAAPRSA